MTWVPSRPFFAHSVGIDPLFMPRVSHSCVAKDTTLWSDWFSWVTRKEPGPCVGCDWAVCALLRVPGPTRTRNAHRLERLNAPALEAVNPTACSPHPAGSADWNQLDQCPCGQTCPARRLPPESCQSTPISRRPRTCKQYCSDQGTAGIAAIGPDTQPITAATGGDGARVPARQALTAIRFRRPAANIFGR